MGRLHFVTGPVRSGKSRFATQLALSWGPEVVYGATYRADPSDSEMAERLRRHRLDRPAEWRTLEAPEDFGQALSSLEPEPSGLLLDCLTMWLGARMDRDDAALLADWEAFLGFLLEAPYPSVIVGNEVGWSLVPESPELRRFRDLAGWLAQATARAADESWLCVAGCPIRLK